MVDPGGPETAGLVGLLPDGRLHYHYRLTAIQIGSVTLELAECPICFAMTRLDNLQAHELHAHGRAMEDIPEEVMHDRTTPQGTDTGGGMA